MSSSTWVPNVKGSSQSLLTDSQCCGKNTYVQANPQCANQATSKNWQPVHSLYWKKLELLRGNLSSLQKPADQHQATLYSCPVQQPQRCLGFMADLHLEHSKRQPTNTKRKARWLSFSCWTQSSIQPNLIRYKLVGIFQEVTRKRQKQQICIY